MPGVEHVGRHLLHEPRLFDSERRKVWLPAKRKIAKELGLDPDNVSIHELRRIEAIYKKRNGLW